MVKMNSIQTTIWVLLAFVVLLLSLVQVLVRSLRREDAVLFERLGCPDVFTNNNFPQAYRFWRWLYTSPLSPALSNRSRAIAWIIRLLTPIYVCAVLALAVTVWSR